MSIAEPNHKNGLIADGDVARSALARLKQPLSQPKDIEVPLNGAFQLSSGELLADPHIRVRRHGRRNAAPVLVMGGISSGRKLTGPDGWWNDIVGQHKAVDLDRHAVLGLDFAPAFDERIAISPTDQAKLVIQALDYLGIGKLRAIVGASYGGLVALAFGALAPERVASLCVISAAHTPSPLASAWRGVQRRIVEFAIEQGAPGEGVALARQLAMITYRSKDEFARRFHNLIGPDGTTDLDRYLISRGEAYRASMSPKRWLSLSEAIDRTNISPEQIRVPTTLVACPSDQIVPMELMSELANRLPNFTALHALPSFYGHDAFLKEGERGAGIIESFLKITP